MNDAGGGASAGVTGATEVGPDGKVGVDPGGGATAAGEATVVGTTPADGGGAASSRDPQLPQNMAPGRGVKPQLAQVMRFSTPSTAGSSQWQVV